MQRIHHLATTVIVVCSVAACSPYVYKDEITTFSNGVSDLKSAYTDGLNALDQDRDRQLRADWTANTDNVGVAEGCYDYDRNEQGTLQPCDIVAIDADGRAVVTPLDDLQRQLDEEFAGNKVFFDALSKYAGGLAAISKAEDRESFNKQVENLERALAGLSNNAKTINPTFGGIGTNLNAGVGLLGSGLGAFLDRRRYEALQSSVERAHPAIEVLGPIIGETLARLRGARLDVIATRLRQLQRGLNPNLATHPRTIEEHQGRLAALDTEFQIFAAVRAIDPKSAANSMVTAHSELRDVLKDKNRQLEPVLEALSAFVNKANEVRKAFEERPSSS